MPGFYKTGAVSTSEFLETESQNLVYNTSKTRILTLPYSYVPAKDTDNSCLRPVIVEIDSNTLTPTTVLRVIVDVSWEGFDSSSTAGTFNATWNTYSLKREDGSTVWSSPISDALNNKQNLKTLILSATRGNYTYDTTLTLSQSYIDTYAWCGIGVRVNYSNGTGKFMMNKIITTYDKYSVSSTIKQRFGKEYISTEEFIEY